MSISRSQQTGEQTAVLVSLRLNLHGNASRSIWCISALVTCMHTRAHTVTFTISINWTTYQHEGLHQICRPEFLLEDGQPTGHSHFPCHQIQQTLGSSLIHMALQKTNKCYSRPNCIRHGRLNNNKSVTNRLIQKNPSHKHFWLHISKIISSSTKMSFPLFSPIS